MLITEALEVIKDIEKESNQYKLAKLLRVSQGTISNYTKHGKYPDLRAAGYIWGKYGIQVEPFTEKALEKEWEYQKKTGV